MKTSFINTWILFFTGVLILSACSTEVREGQEDSEFPPSTTPTISIMVKEEEDPIAENNSSGLSDQAYVAQSGAYKLSLPKEWNCSEIGDFQVNCQAQDQTAEIQADITATGYELDQTAFLSFTHAELVHAYSEVKEYVEGERLEEEGLLKSNSTWRYEEVYWKGTDMFLRTNGTVLHLRTSAQQPLYEEYSDLFASISESLEITPTVLNGTKLYAKRFSHTAPDSFFKVDMPTSWGRYLDAATVENTIIEGFLSPDIRAAVQIAVYNRGSLIEQSLKAEKTLEIMRAQYGHDLRVSHDKALPDGRERLAWYAEKKDVNGISFFDSFGSSLYVFSIVWEESTENFYQPLLEEIAASFNRE